VVVVKFALGHGQYGAADSVVMNFSRPFDPVGVLSAVVRHFEPVWAVSGWHRLRRAQRPRSASAPWLGPTTYLPGPRPTVAGADTIAVGEGTLLDFTDRGRIAPDDETILAAAAAVLSVAPIPWLSKPFPTRNHWEERGGTTVQRVTDTESSSGRTWRYRFSRRGDIEIESRELDGDDAAEVYARELSKSKDTSVVIKRHGIADWEYVTEVDERAE
jgi:hypothetical protein